MFDTKSDYALNKRDPDAIVCKSVTGVHIRLTREDFETEEEFLTWKAWSDEDWHDEEKANHVEANHTTYLGDLPEDVLMMHSPEVILERRLDRRRRAQFTEETILAIRKELTEKQFRRLWLYCVNGMTEEEIARQEGRTHQGISKSIIAARKKIFEKFSSNGFLEVAKQP